MQRFEKEEAEEEAQRKALLEKAEDDDGFVTVTYKRKRGRDTRGNHGLPSDGAGVTSDGAKKRKGAGELTDFYRFQVRLCLFARSSVYPQLTFMGVREKACFLHIVFLSRRRCQNSTHNR